IRFRSLDFDDLTEIAELELNSLRDRLREQHIRLTFASTVAEVIAKAAQGQGAGARGIKRAVEQMITVPVSERLVETDDQKQDWLHLEVNGQSIHMEWV